MSLHSSSIIAIGVQYFGARAPNVTFVNHIYGQDCCIGCQDGKQCQTETFLSKVEFFMSPQWEKISEDQDDFLV